MTAIDPHDPQLVFDALNAGALEIRPKLPFLDAPNYEAERTRLVSLIKTLSQVPVVTRRRKNKTLGKTAIKLTHREMKPAVPHDKRYSHVLIGASTGGPEVVQGILGHLKVPFPLPIVIVQHISAGFVEGLANWLAESTRHRVSVCQATEKPDKGRVYLAPDGHHLCFDSSRCLRIVKGPPRGYQRPSIDELFSSAAPRIGSDTIAVLLSGMGHDGVDGLCELHRKGALTIVQELSTCVVPSMPRCAIEADVADLELTPVEIAKTLNRLARCS
jgi:two-component system chemotaxis response regulator CheB